MLEIISKNIGYIIAIVSGLGVMWGWIAKPIKNIQAENAKQTAKLSQLDADTADLLCSQLTQEHDRYISLGWCPAADKQRLDSMYTRYKARGRNHIAKHYMEDIVKLPEREPGK